MPGTIHGSMAYMPREQLANFKFVSPACDVFSIGATFYEMLTGKTPYDFKEDVEPMGTILSGQIIPIHKRAPELPSALLDTINRSLCVDSTERYQDAGEMLADLKRALTRG